MRNSPKFEQMVSDIEQGLIKDGLIIEAGFAGYKLMAMSKDAPDIQISECRLAFFAGANHLYTTMMRVMDAGEEPTNADLQRMEMIHDELERFAKEALEPMHAASVKTKGSA